ncbi:unnamed protein product [Mucor hiemalis]
MSNEQVEETMEIDQVTLVEETIVTEKTTVVEEVVESEQVAMVDPASTGYTLFVPDLTSSLPTLISSTGNRYNDSIRNSLEKDMNVIQQRVNLTLQTEANNFYRNAKWSPDGSCLLTSSADDVIRLFQLPSNVYEDAEKSNEVLSMVPLLGIREGESVYDFAWFPSMNSQDPSTNCFLTSVRDHPIQLWDVATGTVRASYSAIDHCEKFIGPNVLSFNLDGSKIYCGYENMIEIFDVHRPGPDSQKIPTIPKRKSKKGQKGIISCLDFCPDYSGLYAAGSYSQSIGIYDESNHELCLKLTGFSGGTTQVKFSKDGTLLFSASRHANSILCWDIRDSANILYELPRPGKTNQRIGFDIDATGRYLMTGDELGNISIYDVFTGEQENVETKDRLITSFKAHNGNVIFLWCCNLY